jgi:hypothetical protein
MRIRLSKGKEDKPGTLTCTRDDGSCTWQRSSPFFALHDLIHYAVETTLGYEDAFFGLVARGKDLDAFGTRNGVKDHYTAQEGWAESIVGLLQYHAVAGHPLGDDELLAMLNKTCADRGVPAPPVTAGQLAQIREKVRALHARWYAVPEGEVLELVF